MDAVRSDDFHMFFDACYSHDLPPKVARQERAK
jgi:hypothetical protein